MQLSRPSTRPLALLCLLAGACSLGPAASAATFYLAPNGVDTAGRSGASNAPWASINHAMSRMRDGDDLVLQDGTYRFSSSQTIWRNASGGDRVVVRGASDTGVVLDFAGIDTDWTDGLRVISSGVTVKDIDVKNVRGGTGIITLTGDDVTIDGCRTYDNGGGGINIGGDKNPYWDNAPKNCVIRYCSAWNNCLMNKPAHWNYKGWATNGGGWPSAISVAVAKDAKIVHCWAAENWGEGILMTRVRGGNTEVSDNYARDNYSVNIYTDNVTGTSDNWAEVKNNTAETQRKAAFYRSGSPAHNFMVASEDYDGFLVGSNPTRFVSLVNNTAKDGGHNFILSPLGKPVSEVWLDKNTAAGSTWGSFKNTGATKVWRGTNTGF